MADNNYSVINKTAAQINESLTKADTATTNIGTLSNLTTDTKTALVPAINEVDANADAANTRADIREAEGVEVTSRDYSELPMLCSQPPILYGNGTPAEAVVPTNWIQLADGGYNWNGLPSAIGQQYFNTAEGATNRLYTAVSNGNGSLAWQN